MILLNAGLADCRPLSHQLRHYLIEITRPTAAKQSGANRAVSHSMTTSTYRKTFETPTGFEGHLFV